MYPIISRDNTQAKKECYAFSVNEFDKLVSRFIPSHEQIRWNNLKDKLEFVANYYATADDLAYLGRVAIALSGSAAPIAVERYGGFNHIVIKGTPSLQRKVMALSGKLSPPMVVSFAIGKEKALQTIKQGAIVTVIFVTSYRITEYFFKDSNKRVLAKLFGVIASDIIKVGLAALITSITLKTMISVGVIAAGGSAALFVVVFVGVVASFATSKIDEEYNLTERFQKKIVSFLSQKEERDKWEMEDKINQYRAIQSFKNSGFSL
ncbi:hypothetical protein CGJ25_19660 [Vibrio parahaemolyticus]|nr:hypothetical protein [Vibrio parahaemolyticus]ALG52889.1 putative membrane protein [Vibrio parahaemolyticus]MCS0043236.1 hypothetical protein [Vibrio parahaemolyticus]TOF29290.1 hypothetical protein CGJ25_19660 [Vibrio parahaemolyticus]TOR39318.1 hypothetical protein CGG76_13105 [Vibrio parahaemolyticus]HCH1191313.1 hypothetical protein [Vibrio parahaemolyticus]